MLVVYLKAKTKLREEVFGPSTLCCNYYQVQLEEIKDQLFRTASKSSIAG